MATIINYARGMILEDRAYSCVLIPWTEGGKGKKGQSWMERRGVTERRGEVFGTKERHCHWCLGEIMSTVPCEGCSYAWYCSIRAELRAPGVM